MNSSSCGRFFGKHHCSMTFAMLFLKVIIIVVSYFTYNTNWVLMSCQLRDRKTKEVLSFSSTVDSLRASVYLERSLEDLYIDYRLLRTP